MKNNITINTRIAPSPTGPLHIGTARTALYNYLYTKKNNGKFFIRIEDTDKKRCKKKYFKDAINSLHILGIFEDDLFIQSQRTYIYKKELERLIKEDKAYVSCEKSKHNHKKNINVIRFKNPKKIVEFNDSIRGNIKIDTTELGDFVIARSISDPLYHFTVVVDDQKMNITNIIRGDDHISNTPRQILLIEALNYQIPKYTHIPLITSLDGKKLSKRKNDTSILNYIHQGYIPEALVNYLFILGLGDVNNSKNDSVDEIRNINQLTSDFDINRIQKKSSVFDIKKLNWINKQYIKKLSCLQIRQKIKFSLIKKFPIKSTFNQKIIKEIVKDLKERFYTFGEMKQSIKNKDYDFLFNLKNIDIQKVSWKNTSQQQTTTHLEKLVDILSKTENFSQENIKKLIYDYIERDETGVGVVLWPFRYSLSGKEKSLDGFLIASIIGKRKTIDRLKKTIKQMK